MTARPASYEAKGRCPGALRPMASGDGLIVRIRPRAASVSVASLIAIAEAARRYGNGFLDLTRRANLQIRGVTEATLKALQARLGQLDLLDETPEAEAVRNILVSPLSGLDPSEVLDLRPMSHGLAKWLASEAAAWTLPPKFALLLDGGGQLPLTGERADIHLVAMRAQGEAVVALGLESVSGVAWIGCAPQAIALRAAIGLIRAIAMMPDPPSRPRELSAADFARLAALIRPQLRQITPPANNSTSTPPALGALSLGESRFAVGVGAPFGRLEAGQLQSLALALQAEDVTQIRLSPWRNLYWLARDMDSALRIVAVSADLGLAVNSGDPLMRIQACTGSPACTAAHVETRAIARGIAALMHETGFAGNAHISGCAKGCARSAPADLMVVGSPFGYRVMQFARSCDEGGVIASRDSLHAHAELVMLEIEKARRDVQAI